jgi:hypothetical protein
MAYDSARGKTVLFGGSSHDGYTMPPLIAPLGDTWEWDGTTWTQREAVSSFVSGPSHLAYDSARGKTVTFGVAGTLEWDGIAGPSECRARALL